MKLKFLSAVWLAQLCHSATALPSPPPADVVSVEANGHSRSVPTEAQEPAPPSALDRRATLPSRDKFYLPPAGFESAAPGTVLRDRPILAAFLGIIPDLTVRAHQVLYRTTAVNGTPVAAVTTIFAPLLFAKKDRLVTYNTAYDSACVDCNPSYAFQFGSLPTNVLLAADFLLLQAYLAKGYVVNSPDYEGPDAAFSVGRLAATGVLDSMRAAQSFGSAKLGLAANAAMVGTGYSGGGLATAWAAALQPTHAPELTIKGWAVGGVPANITAMVPFLDGGRTSGFLPVAIAGQMKPSAYGAELAPVFDRIVTDEGRAAMRTANTQCAVPNLLKFSGKSVLSTSFQTLGDGFLHDPTVSKVLARGTLGVVREETPAAPVYMYHAQQDEVVVYGPAFDTYQRWCANGAAVSFVAFPTGGHVSTGAFGAPGAVDFVQRAFDGSVATSSCSFKTAGDTSVSSSALGSTAQPAAVQLNALVDEVGVDDGKWLDGLGQGQASS
ncbi:Lipase, secreted [Cordyceps fumosorosea ARSEF 2679]|uniref:Lipase, secreted n=1 Tax=Cordyceps fumosorosea (strain ARSEF 2679) TaxID=1081104 RepID=A0A167PAP0_CORFA|nr:Lipase, secreted [Cordyceps fumosorosea ARSEF 2679]OAA56466.1 Lipase, secreted [Cordyceps fumosorosea ARSEF 2679]